MSRPRTHHVTTGDGVTIGASVHGQGPPLVLLPGALGDGDLDWDRLLPHLTDRFTCHLVSMRGRGRSDDHPDLGLGRIIEDYVAYIDSIGDDTSLSGWSGGASHALAVAAQTSAVAAVAPFEPIANGQLDEPERAALGGAVARAGALAADGDLTGAVRAFLGYPFDEAEVALAEASGYIDATSRYVQGLLDFFGQFAQYDGPMPDDPDVLDAIRVPVRVLVGSDTRPVFTASARHVADHVPDATVHTLPGVGHAAPLTHPEALAGALTQSLTSVRQPA